MNTLNLYSELRFELIATTGSTRGLCTEASGTALKMPTPIQPGVGVPDGVPSTTSTVREHANFHGHGPSI